MICPLTSLANSIVRLSRRAPPFNSPEDSAPDHQVELEIQRQYMNANNQDLPGEIQNLCVGKEAAQEERDPSTTSISHCHRCLTILLLFFPSLLHIHCYFLALILISKVSAPGVITMCISSQRSSVSLLVLQKNDLNLYLLKKEAPPSCFTLCWKGTCKLYFIKHFLDLWQTFLFEILEQALEYLPEQ